MKKSFVLISVHLYSTIFRLFESSKLSHSTSPHIILLSSSCDAVIVMPSSIYESLTIDVEEFPHPAKDEDIAKVIYVYLM